MKIQMITILVAFFTPFLAAACAYYFSVSKKHQLENQEEAYKNYYAPLMGLLTHYQLSAISYGIAVGASKQGSFQFKGRVKVDNRLRDLVRNNIAYVPKTIGSKLHQFLMSSDDFFYQEGEDYKDYEHYAMLASESFDLIIIESLKEASVLSRKLGYPDVAEELLSEFLKSFVAKPTNRHLVHG
ncbi:MULTISPECIES: hypothetical protein [Leuconostoc]|jgi:hypothetical protein|uniref:Uncharacterized protein n=2 Tax=Leuconostoc mesenteroides TaxID=1245 RepID=A0A843Z1V4_LEUME|nr:MULTISPECIES: hypothetical protein [Leuconostoc]API72627.1 hypothetical protein A6B45_08020 [Leuconostoc suionicum]MQR27270.1 hypothetical protein [Leuconostoc mesenteroides]BAX71297.1 hypothetical protein LEUCM_01859 [Leuconostoc suionicum]SPE67879.1 hypothetical protein LEM9217_01490 [Leuconostoc mesenteroides]